MDERFPYSPAETANVELVQFGVLSPDEIVMPPRSLARPPLLCLKSLFEFERAGWFGGIAVGSWVVRSSRAAAMSLDLVGGV